jgi:hypothetical protein
MPQSLGDLEQQRSAILACRIHSYSDKRVKRCRFLAPETRPSGTVLP